MLFRNVAFGLALMVFAHSGFLALVQAAPSSPDIVDQKI